MKLLQKVRHQVF